MAACGERRASAASPPSIHGKRRASTRSRRDLGSRLVVVLGARREDLTRRVALLRQRRLGCLGGAIPLSLRRLRRPLRRRDRALRLLAAGAGGDGFLSIPRALPLLPQLRRSRLVFQSSLSCQRRLREMLPPAYGPPSVAAAATLVSALGLISVQPSVLLLAAARALASLAHASSSRLPS